MRIQGRRKKRSVQLCSEICDSQDVVDLATASDAEMMTEVEMQPLPAAAADETPEEQFELTPSTTYWFDLSRHQHAGKCE